MQNKQNIWIDNVKVFACIFVVLGHLFQSMVKSGLLPDNQVYQWFDKSICCFHVQLFFICSGYLYQKYKTVNSLQSWWINIRKKFVVLGIPYVVFSTVTWLLKTAFSGSVNSEIGGLLETLLLNPTAPYWFLYTLFLIFFVTPTFENSKMMKIGFGVAFVIKFLNILGVYTGIFAMDSIIYYEIYFIFGMIMAEAVAVVKVDTQKGIIAGILLGLMFLGVSICIYYYEMYFTGVELLLDFSSSVAVLFIMMSVFQKGKQNRFFAYLIQYTMPIFLMHTLFAAPVRIVLMKFGIHNSMVHLLVGLMVSFAGPIVAAEIMKRVKFLDILLYPGKYFKLINGVKNRERSDG